MSFTSEGRQSCVLLVVFSFSERQPDAAVIRPHSDVNVRAYHHEYKIGQLGDGVVVDFIYQAGTAASVGIQTYVSRHVTVTFLASQRQTGENLRASCHGDERHGLWDWN